MNSRFLYENVTFDAYIDQMKNVISTTRTDITPNSAQRIISANSPFELQPTQKACPKSENGVYANGILLIHGLTDSTFSMRDLANYFHSKCFLVRAILLPGHGTVPGDLLSVTFNEWIKATQYGIESFSGKVNHLYLGGFSTGGSLSVYQSLKRNDIKGLFLFSPAIKIKSKFGFMANWHKAISWALEERKWLETFDDKDFAKYESFAKNGADQIYLLTQENEHLRQHKQITIPMFIAVSQDDMTVDTGATISFFRAQTHPQSKMILYTSDNKIQDKDKRIKRVQSSFPKQHILDLSHLAIPISPENSHYGKNGDYTNCLHYLNEEEKMLQCQKQNNTPRGEITKKNLDKTLLRRVTYNPAFQDMTKDMDFFLKSLQ